MLHSTRASLCWSPMDLLARLHSLAASCWSHSSSDSSAVKAGIVMDSFITSLQCKQKNRHLIIQMYRISLFNVCEIDMFLIHFVDTNSSQVTAGEALAVLLGVSLAANKALRWMCCGYLWPRHRQQCLKDIVSLCMCLLWCTYYQHNIDLELPIW